MTQRILLLLLMGIGAAQVASAKCGSITYEISVTVQERGSRTPLPDVELVFFRPAADTALQIESDGGSGRAMTDSAGNWQGRVKFNTYSGSGFLFGDKCKAKLDALELVAIPRDRPAERSQFRHLKSTVSADRFVSRLEPVLVKLYPGQR